MLDATVLLTVWFLLFTLGFLLFVWHTYDSRGPVTGNNTYTLYLTDLEIYSI